MTELAKVLKDIRVQAGLTQEQLGEILGVGQAYVSLTERGERGPSWRYLVSFANATGANLIQLLREAGLIDRAGVTVEQEIAALLEEHPDLAAAFDYIRDYPHRIPEILKYIRFLRGEEEE